MKEEERPNREELSFRAIANYPNDPDTKNYNCVSEVCLIRDKMNKTLTIRYDAMGYNYEKSVEDYGSGSFARHKRLDFDFDGLAGFAAGSWILATFDVFDRDNWAINTREYVKFTFEYIISTFFGDSWMPHKIFELHYNGEKIFVDQDAIDKQIALENQSQI
jgi:hypothetical protein